MKFLKRVSFIFFAVLLIGIAFCPSDTYAATNITISSVQSVPDSIVKGKSVSLRGIIKSNSKITQVTGKIVNTSNNKTCFSKSVAPKSYSYSLAGSIDSTLKFGQLPTGKFKYSVVVKTASGVSKTVISKTFQVVAATNITISNVQSVPNSIVKGKSVSLRGIIKSNSKITQVTGKIVNTSNNKTCFSKSVAPKSYSYSLAGPIDSTLKFGQLPTGKFKYSVTVKTASGVSKTVISKTFQVIKTASTMSVSPNVSPSTVVKGKGVAVYGYVKSNYNITQVTATIVGTTYVKTVKPNAKIFNLAAVDSAMKFSKLNVGTYSLKVSATDSSGTTKSKQVTCTITQSAATKANPSNSKLTVLPKVAPSTATAGTGIFVYGTVTSNYKITSVTAEIVGTGYKKTVAPNTLSYSISGMDSAMKFSALAAGTYILQVTAKDASGKQVVGQVTCTLTPKKVNADGSANAMVSIALNEPNANVGLSNKYNGYYKGGCAWCAYFVAWCARQAKVSTVAIPNSYLCRNLVSYYQGQNRYYTYAKVKAGSYTPQKGDLIFYSTSSGGTATHVGLVTSVNTSTKQITTKEGNTRTSTGGSWVYSYTMSYASNKPWSNYNQYIIGYAHPNY